jgi:LysR family glycine cleavage system transcriptional activator
VEPGIRTFKKCETKLLPVSQVSLDQIDQEIEGLRYKEPAPLTIALQTYFLTRWLSPRLMRFTAVHPEIGLRFVPLNFIGEMESIDADISICWAKEGLIDAPHERLFACPACPTGNGKIAERVKREGMDDVLLSVPLLLDSSDSAGWQDWFDRAGLDLKNSQQGLSIADSNSRVQAVIDGQGIALWDRLVAHEISSGHLQYLSDIWLDEYGYYVRAKDSSLESKAVELFLNWLRDESKDAPG